jgi:hypothetical protein
MARLLLTIVQTRRKVQKKAPGLRLQTSGKEEGLRPLQASGKEEGFRPQASDFRKRRRSERGCLLFFFFLFFLKPEV